MLSVGRRALSLPGQTLLSSPEVVSSWETPKGARGGLLGPCGGGHLALGRPPQCSSPTVWPTSVAMQSSEVSSEMIIIFFSIKHCTAALFSMNRCIYYLFLTTLHFLFFCFCWALLVASCEKLRVLP